MSQAYSLFPRAKLNEPAWRGLTDRAHRLTFHAWLGQHTNLIGTLYWPPGYISADMNWPIETVPETVSEVVAAGLLRPFEDGRHFLIPDFLTWNTIHNGNVLKAALKQFEALPADPAIDIVFKSLEPFAKQFGDGFESQLETARKRKDTSFANTLSLSLPQAVPLSESGGSESGGHVDKDGFEEFYSAFPNHVAKASAQVAWNKALGKASAPVIIAGAKRYAATQLGKDLKYTKHPDTWLNEERWQDGQPKPAAALVVPKGWDPAVAEAMAADIGVDRFNNYFGESEIAEGRPKIIKVFRESLPGVIADRSDVCRAIATHLGKDARVEFVARKAAA